MASFNKFQDFVEQLGLAGHNLNTHTFKIALTNTAPVATQTAFDPVTNHAAPTNTNGYTAGGEDTQNTWAESSGTGTMTGTAVTWTATGGSLGSFRYVVLYNDTHASDALCGWWDYGSSVTLATGETFTWKPNNSATTGTILTIA